MMSNFWDYSVWGYISIVTVLLASLLFANFLKSTIKFLRDSLIPTSVLAGVILLIISSVFKAFSSEYLFDTEFFGGSGMNVLEIITYHALALGFIASTFKTTEGKINKQRTVEIVNTGVTTVSTYLIQAIVGLAITIIASLIIEGFFPASGVLLCFGFGQGTGQALNYGNIYETDYGFIGGRSFGLTIAALGFLSASIGGVIHLNILKRRKKIAFPTIKERQLTACEYSSENEIPENGHVDKITVQLALVILAYFIAYLLMIGLGELLPGMKSTIFGFNFLLGVLSATLIKVLLKFLNKKKIIKKQYTNNYLMNRISNFFFDLMVVAGIAAIKIDLIKDYWGILLILAVVGAVVTYIYNFLVAKTLFKNYQNEQFLAMYGMLTGTASTGIILLRELDGDFKTPAAENLIYQNFPAIIFGFPMMLLATFAPQQPFITLLICIGYFAVLNVLLFRSKIFKSRRKSNNSE